MSKPKIYGYCDAGCKWETVHKSDFDKIIPYVEIEQVNSVAYLEVGKTYKIVSNSTTSYGFSIQYHYHINSQYEGITADIIACILPTFDKYKPYVYVKVLEVDVKTVASNFNKTTLTVVYEVNDKRYTETYTTSDSTVGIDLLDNPLRVYNASQVLLCNESGEVTLAAEQVFIKYADDEYGTNMTSTYSGQEYIGFSKGLTESNLATDYDWCHIGGGSVGNNSVNTSKLVDGAVTPEKTSFVEGGYVDPDGNLVNEEDLETNLWYNASNGEQQRNEWTSPYCCNKNLIEVEANTKYSAYPTPYSIVEYDSNGTMVKANYPNIDTITTQENTKYVGISWSGSNSQIGTKHFVFIKGDYTGYVDYNWIPLHLKGIDISDEVQKEIEKIDLDTPITNKVNEVVDDKFPTSKYSSKNLYNYDFAVSTKGSWWFEGKPQSNEYTGVYTYSNPISVTAGETIYIQTYYNLTGDPNIYAIKISRYEFMDGTGAVVSYGMPNTHAFVHQLTVPENANTLVLTIPYYDGAEEIYKTITVAKEQLNGFVEYYEGQTIDNLYIHKDNILGLEDENETTKLVLDLPLKYDLVQGEAFELFYEGIIKAKEPLNYNILVNCSIGNAYRRKFVATPSSTGEYDLTITITDDYDNQLAYGKTTLIVKAPMVSPSSQVNVLCMGDSLTTGGVWVDEFYRRLVKTSDKTLYNAVAPIGKGLSNIKFIGKKTSPNGAGYEGFGGWTYGSYLNTETSTNDYWITVSSHDKTDSDQESIYQDVNGVQWQLETIETNRLKFKRYSGTGSMPLSGTLTWVNAGVNTSSITFTKSELAEGNPFAYDSEINFDTYCNDLGISTIDIVYILLGWNSSGDTKDTYINSAKSFVDLLKAFNPNIKVVFLGLQMPSLDGLGTNYGATGRLVDYRGLQQFVINHNAWNQELADYYSGDFIQISGQLDSRNNCIQQTVDVNLRNTTKETIGANGVHPAIEGYYQIADAVYRHFNNR